MKLLKILKNIYYCILYHSTPLYRIYPKLDILLIYLEEVGIKSISKDDYECVITFKDNTIFTFWNVNRWYAWMKHGTITFSNNEVLKWNERRPSFEVLYKYKKFIKKHETVEYVEDNDYTKYIPLKVLRKAKLKKLKN